MEREKKTNSEFIIDALLSGQDLRSPEITNIVSENSGKKMKIQDIASILAKLSNSEKCDLGFFIQKKKTHKGYTYSLVPEAFSLPAEALYDLTRRTGKNRYTLEQTLVDYPELKKYVKNTVLKNRAIKQEARRSRKLMENISGSSRPPRGARNASEGELSDQAIAVLIARVLEEISEQGGLNINVNLNVRFTGIGIE